MLSSFYIELKEIETDATADYEIDKEDDERAEEYEEYEENKRQSTSIHKSKKL